MSTFLSRRFNEGSAVDRLLRWAWPEDDRIYSGSLALDQESTRLATIALTWFLTSPDRVIRDRATKGLVNLLRRCPRLIVPTINKFADVNDLYVIERLYAVVYGTILHLDDDRTIRVVSDLVIKLQFAQGSPEPHILLRDYARGIVEYAYSRGIVDDHAIRSARPPYNSQWPLNEPTFADLKSKLDSPPHWPLLSSLGEMGDFYCYTMNAVEYWTNLPIEGPSSNGPRRKVSASKKSAQGWILQRVIELGWTPERFNEFDQDVPRATHGRMEHNVERIGKKYQWIALYQYLAHLADNCSFGGHYGEATDYEGPWQINKRDMDPSLLLRTSHDHDWQSDSTSWWSPWQHDFAASVEMTHLQWLRDTSLHPLPEQLLVPVQPNTDVQWFNLESYSVWYEPVPAHVHRDEVDKRQYTLAVRAFLLPESRWPEFREWFASDDQHDWEAPEGLETYHTYLGEYPWGRSLGDSYAEVAWLTGEQDWHLSRQVHPPFAVAVPSASFHWERAYDCSTDQTFRRLLPAPWLMSKMSLTWNNRALEVRNPSGKLVAFDPAVESPGPSALLLDRLSLEGFLRREGLRLFWRVSSEKLIIEADRDSGNWPGRVASYWLLSFDGERIRLHHEQAVHTTVGPSHDVFINRSKD